MLEIKNMHVDVEGKTILRGVNLTINQGEVHAIMGPNGSGKSTLGYALSGKDGYTLTQGEILFHGQSIKDLGVAERAAFGIFLGMQYPVELPGVNNAVFLRLIYNKMLKNTGKEPVDAMDFMSLAREKMAIVEMDERFLSRNVNEGFSGGEKKRNEILQMLFLEPQLAILDEHDSGLDIDALQSVARAVNTMRSQEKSLLMVTHYQRLLDYIVPDYVHVFVNGKIIESGDHTLALKLEQKGYSWLGVASE